MMLKVKLLVLVLHLRIGAMFMAVFVHPAL